MFDPMTLGVGFLIWTAFKKRTDTQFGILTPEREEIYRNAMEKCYDPKRLFEFAKLFDQYGLKTEALMMRKRAELRARPPEVKKQHDEIFAKALQSDNPEAILEVAKVFHGMTATVRANQLRERAKSLANQKTEAPENMSGHKPEADSGLSENSEAAE